MLKKYFHKNTVRYFLLVGAALATLLLVGYLTNSSHSRATEWNLFKTPESTVELYFTDHSALPKKYAPGEVSVISFTLATYESKKTSYAYEIVQQNEASGAINILTSGKIEIKGNHRLTKEIPITYGEGGARSKITIRFPEEKQAIHYWVEKLL